MDSVTIKSLCFLLANLLVFRASAAHGRAGFLECLTVQFEIAGSNSNLIYTPNNASYSSIFQSTAWNERVLSSSSQKPLAIVTPINESEIQATVHCSKKHGVQIRVRSGGHDFEGLSYVSGSPFVIVDMRNLRSVSINIEDNTAWVQTGATLGQLYYTIAQTSRTLAFPAGVCPTVGVGGHFSGGGFGMLSRKHGLAIDHIIDATLIDAKGRILDRGSMGEDLFWAIRGGGASNFGIVIAFKVRLVSVPETVTVFNVSRTVEQNATQLVHKWQYISDKIDENLFIRLFMKSITSSSSRGERIGHVSFTSLFIGPVEDLLPIMREKFPELGLVEKDCVEMSWIESQLFFADIGNQSLDAFLSDKSWRYGDNVYFKIKSDYVTQPIPEHGLEGIWDFLNEELEKQAELEVSPYGGILPTFSEDETPFPHRSGNIYMIQYAILWHGETDSERHVNWIRKLYSYMTPYVSKYPRATYSNYRDLDIGMNNNKGNTSYKQASVWGFKYFKNNFNRLVHVKTKVDPSNLFRNEQSIPPTDQQIVTTATDTDTTTYKW